jgi:hypothetical protein
MDRDAPGTPHRSPPPTLLAKINSSLLATGGRGIGTAVTHARDHLPTSVNVVSNTLQSGITRVEDRARFSVGGRRPYC